MSHVIVPYSKIIIPPYGHQSEKVVYAPILETFLYHRDRETGFSFYSLVDSGADFCVFPSKFGEVMGLDIKSGDEIPSFGVGGQETLYFHQIRIGVIIDQEEWKFNCTAGFSVKMNRKGTGFLGRKGFFDLFKEVSFNQNKKMFRLNGTFEKGQVF